MDNTQGQVIRIRRTNQERKDAKELRVLTYVDVSILIDKLRTEYKTANNRARELWLLGEIRHLRLIKRDLIRKAAI